MKYVCFCDVFLNFSSALRNYHSNTTTKKSPLMLFFSQYSRNNTVLSKRRRMDGSLQLNKRTNEDLKSLKKHGGLACLKIFLLSLLTLFCHYQRELLNHSCQQLHHGLYVLSAEEANTNIRYTSRKCSLE